MSRLFTKRLSPEERADMQEWLAMRVDFRRRVEAALDPDAPDWPGRMDTLIELMRENPNWYVSDIRRARR